MAALRFGTLSMSEKTEPEQYVADAAILLDLDQTRLLPVLLDSNVNLITTPNVLAVLDQHCRQELEERCYKKQVRIEVATTDDMNKLIDEIGPANRMSVTDGLLCRIAKRMNVSLLSGCEYLSRDAEQRGIRARSIIWVLNRLVKNGLIKPATAARKLADLQTCNPWINKRLARQQIGHWQAISTEIMTGEGKATAKLYSA